MWRPSKIVTIPAYQPSSSDSEDDHERSQENYFERRAKELFTDTWKDQDECSPFQKDTPMRVSRPELDKEIYPAAEANDLTTVINLLADGASPNSAFEKAIQHGNVTAVQVLVDAKVNVNLPISERGFYKLLTPIDLWVFITSAYERDRPICEILLKAGARTERAFELSFPSWDGVDSVALNQWKLKDTMVKLNLMSIDVPHSPIQRGKIFHQAIGANALHIAEVYLKSGMDPNILDPEGRAFHLRYPTQADIVGYTAMDKALFDENIGLLKLLLKYGVNPVSKEIGLSQKIIRTLSPLQECIQENKLECLKEMLFAGAIVTGNDLKFLSSSAKSAKCRILLNLAQAKQSRQDPVQQIIVVLQKNVNAGISAFISEISSIFQNPYRDLILALRQENDLSQIKTLLEQHKETIEAERYQFIEEFIIHPLEMEQALHLIVNNYN